MRVASPQEETDRLGGAVRWIWRGQTDSGPRATWRLVVPVVVLVAIVAVGGRLLAFVDLPDALLNAPDLAVVLVGLVGCVVTARRLGDRSLGDLGFEFGADWNLDFAVGIGIGLLFQAVATALWMATGDLTVTDTLASGGASNATELVIAVVATLFAFFVVGLWEEFVFRGLIVRNIAEGLYARNSSPRGAMLVATVVSVVVFALLHGAGAAAALTDPTFAVIQAFGAGVYFLVAYVLTGSLALPVAIHFITNTWTRLIVGEAGGAFPTLIAAERAGPEGIDALVVTLPSMALLIGLVVGWAMYTGRAVPSFSDAYERVAAESLGAK